MSVPLHNSVRTEGTDVYCRVVPVKRLRRTENVRGTFEGVSAPREFLQPSLLQEHRTPYGSRHLRLAMFCARDFIPHIAKGASSAPFHFWLFSRCDLLFHSRVLFHGLRADGRGRFGSVAYLRVGRSSRHRAPRLATRHSCAHCNANKHC